MDKELEATLKKRYEKIIFHINEIWKLEKEKMQFRERHSEAARELKIALRSNNGINRIDSENSGGSGITIYEHRVASALQNIDLIFARQSEILEEIRKIVKY